MKLIFVIYFLILSAGIPQCDEHKDKPVEPVSQVSR